IVRLTLLCCSFFFQAEDGIRDDLVTGVQTCALPISTSSGILALLRAFPTLPSNLEISPCPQPSPHDPETAPGRSEPAPALGSPRSEERRVGKEWRSRWEPYP